jgi:hypothetical protein
VAFCYGRLLVDDKRWSEARALFERLLRSDDRASVDAAYALATPGSGATSWLPPSTS